MIEIETFEIKRMFIPLSIRYGQRIINFLYPPFYGSYHNCFKTMNNYKVLKPANGFELSILMYGIRQVINFEGGDYPEWEDIWKRCIENHQTILPSRNLWIPKNIFTEDRSLSGVLVDNDAQRCRTIQRTHILQIGEKMEIPNLSDSDKWTQDEKGIYISKDNNLKFIPIGKFRLGKHTKSSFIKDNYASTIFTRTGAEIFARTAYNINQYPCIRGLDLNLIKESEQRDTMVYEYKDGSGLVLDGQHFSNRWDYRLIGVFKETSEERSKKIFRLEIKEPYFPLQAI